MHSGLKASLSKRIAPDTISEAEAEPLLTSITSGISKKFSVAGCKIFFFHFLNLCLQQNPEVRHDRSQIQN